MKLTDWQPGHPITLVIGAEVWEGVLYRRHGRLRIYVVGELPKSWYHCDKHTFNIDGQFFNVIGYMTYVNELDEVVREKYHPFGNNWIMERCLTAPYSIVEATIE